MTDVAADQSEDREPGQCRGQLHESAESDLAGREGSQRLTFGRFIWFDRLCLGSERDRPGMRPFLVPGFAMIGLLLGVALARDSTDRANERIGDLIDQAWDLRDRDIRMLDAEIKIARRSRSRGVDALEQKRAVLMIQSPEQLIRHYGLIDRRSIASDASTPPLGPTTEQVLLSWKRPSAGDGGSFRWIG